MSHLNPFGITHLRHVDLAVPDYETQRTFYKDTWGLTEVGTDGDLSYLAAEGSPEQYVVRLRKATEKRLDLISFGATDEAAVDALAAKLGSEGIQLVGEPAKLQTAGGGYGFRFFDIDGRTIEVSTDVETRQHRPIEEGEAIPVRISHAVMNSNDPNTTKDFYESVPGLQAERQPLEPAHGRDDALHALQRLAPQPGHRARPAHLGAPRVVRDARHRRVHARHRPGHARRHQEGLGPGPPPGRQQHVLLLPRPERQHDGVHHRAGAAGDRPVASHPVRHRRPQCPGPVGHLRPDERV